GIGWGCRNPPGGRAHRNPARRRTLPITDRIPARISAGLREVTTSNPLRNLASWRVRLARTLAGLFPDTQPDFLHDGRAQRHAGDSVASGHRVAAVAVARSMPSRISAS